MEKDGNFLRIQEKAQRKKKDGFGFEETSVRCVFIYTEIEWDFGRRSMLAGRDEGHTKIKQAHLTKHVVSFNWIILTDGPLRY